MQPILKLNNMANNHKSFVTNPRMGQVAKKSMAE